MTEQSSSPVLADGWQVEGPKHKDADRYLSKDGDNPEAPWPGYGWPLGTECWYFVLTGHGARLFAAGSTAELAARRAEVVAEAHGVRRARGTAS